jgi:hypothetical protein
MDRLVETVKESGGKVDGCICIQCGDVKLETGRKRSEMMIHGPCTRGPVRVTDSREIFTGSLLVG